MKYENVYTIVFFKDGREKLIKGFEKADKYTGDHAAEILFTYTDFSGKEHLEKMGVKK